MLVDTHCHLHLLDDRSEAVVEMAGREGVGHLVDVGIDLASSADAVANAGRLPRVSATVGIHPHNAIELTPGVLERLRGLLAAPGVVGVGETGLDYFRDHAPREQQREAFAISIGLAREFDKALVVHCREAFADVLSVLDAEGAPERVVFHCFTGDRQMAAEVVSRGWTVSFSGNVTFTNAPGQREACAVVPLDQLVLETDSPFLSPHPFRGQANRPDRIGVTARTVAEVHGVPVEEVARVTTDAASRTFKLRLEAPEAGQDAG